MPQWLRVRRVIIYCCYSFVDLVDAPLTQDKYRINELFIIACSCISEGSTEWELNSSNLSRKWCKVRPPVKGQNVIFWNLSNCHRMKRYPTSTFSLNNVEFVSNKYDCDCINLQP